MLERRAAALASPDEKVDVLMQAASVWADKVGDGGSAAEAYERVLEIDPSNFVASTSSEELYRQRKVWPRLVELLLARIEYVDGPRGAHQAASSTLPPSTKSSWTIAIPRS